MAFKSPEDFHNKLGLIFHGLLSLPLAAFVYLFLEIRNHNRAAIITDNSISLTLTILLPLCALGSFLHGYFYFRKHKPEQKSIGLVTKLVNYYKQSLKLYTYIEIAAVFLVLGLYLTTSAVFIIGYVFLLFFMSLHRPTPQKYVKDIPLTEREKKIILHKGNFEEIDRQNTGN